MCGLAKQLVCFVASLVLFVMLMMFADGGVGLSRYASWQWMYGS